MKTKKLLTLSMVGLFAINLTTLLTGCAQHYVNKPITDVTANDAYYETNPMLGGVTDDVEFILAFSGGGMRASALSYGVLEVLADTKVQSAGGEIRLLDEVDYISSVSGGSYTAAYYGLFGDRIFEDFEEKFLTIDFQGMLKWRLFSPLNWPKFMSKHYGRTEMAADLLDKILFENKKIGDFIHKKGPVIAIQTTDVTLREKFAFYPSEFKLICSDLLDFPVSRAVVASSAVPFLFNSIVINNYAGECGYQLPQWADRALDNKDWDSRVDNEAVRIHSYLDREQRPYIHLMDGGMADNLGVRSYLNRLFTRGDREDVVDIDGNEVKPTGYTDDDDERALERHGLDDVKKVVYIIVNAEVAPGGHWDKKNRDIGIFDTIMISTSVGVNRYNFATIKFVERRLEEWHLEMMEEHCKYYEPSNEEDDLDELSLLCKDIDTYLIYLDFDLINDREDRRYFKNIPTSFVLDEEQVQRLKEMANTLLTNSSDFQRLIKDLNSRYMAEN